jgi:hypothetical protein
VVGVDYLDEISDNPSIAIPRLPKMYLMQVCGNIPETIRASYATIPPPDLGQPGTGKLKAGKWMALIKFDLPVTLVKILHSNPGLESTTVDLICATLLLAITIRYGFSTVTSPTHQEKYLEYMQQYLWILRRLYPQHHLRPNHHAALHLGDFLKRFGPARNFWMLPFKRIIVKLQHSPSNYKNGE